jgi:hypothetical protein
MRTFKKLIDREVDTKAKMLVRNKKMQTAIKERFQKLLLVWEKDLKLLEKEIDQRENQIHKEYSEIEKKIKSEYDAGKITLDQYLRKLVELDDQKTEELIQTDLYEKSVELRDLMAAARFVVERIENCDFQIARSIIYTLNDNKELLEEAEFAVRKL